jgi:phospholipid/cholesterol/gamma-HCH transport system permease protein
MTKTNHSSSYEVGISEDSAQGLNVRISGQMNASTAGSLLRELDLLMKRRAPASLTVDLERVSYLDDFGVLVLYELKSRMKSRDGGFHLANVNAREQKFLDLLKFDAVDERVSAPRKTGRNMFVRLGDGVFRFISEFRFMLTFTGSVCLAFLRIGLHPKSLRLDDSVDQMQRTGVDALPIVALISLLLGLIIAFMSSIQLKQFGADIYVASLVGLAMTRELGPIMTAIIVAGRSGSAYAAEIGTMKISEEIDALSTMGFDPTLFLAAPRVLASLVMVPFLTLFSMLFGMGGGLIVSVGMLDITTDTYVAQTLRTLTLLDVGWGLAKSAAFAILIAWVSCLRGFQAKGGPAGVGQVTTSAVVSSIFLIILMNSIFSVIDSYWF